jgi:cytochrome b involved in lipid metabolism
MLTTALRLRLGLRLKAGAARSACCTALRVSAASGPALLPAAPLPLPLPLPLAGCVSRAYAAGSATGSAEEDGRRWALAGAVAAAAVYAAGEESYVCCAESCPHAIHAGAAAAAAPAVSSAKTYRLSDVAAHDSVEKGVWVHYRGGVFDVTDFLSSHPGGAEKLMQAAGGDLYELWRQPAFQQHFASPLAAELLEEMRVGSLHPEDVPAGQGAGQGAGLPHAPPQHSTKHIYDCIVVGAGVSGLRCAHALSTQHGVRKQDILLLEAQDYVGGRVRQVCGCVCVAVRVCVGGEAACAVLCCALCDMLYYVSIL